MQSKDGFFIGRIKSIKYAFKGFFILITTEHSVRAQFFVLLACVGLGIYLQISPYEWMAKILAFGLIFTAESLNTAIEEIANFIHPEYHKHIGKIKDIAAGAVTFAALTTFIVLCFIYLPKFFA
ncbi:diacylglycerol kinase [Capnocytophaga sp. ARDL2]|uniref:diacylglycerol kinase n=1 Tax=Capnocytophaga sp. ARDL2 TaxID=3238809 RepID=UPI003558B3A4